MLNDMFQGSAAQMMAILETLADSNRRVLQNAPASPDGEPEVLDVCSELFFASMEIVAGSCLVNYLLKRTTLVTVITMV